MDETYYGLTSDQSWPKASSAKTKQPRLLDTMADKTSQAKAAPREEFLDLPEDEDTPPASDQKLELLSRLKIVAALRPGEKIGLNPPRIIQNTVSERLSRWWKSWWANEGRDATLDFLADLFEQAFQHLKQLHSRLEMSEDRRLNLGLVAQFRAEIRNAASRGLNALISTYHDDQTVTSRLQTLRESVDLQLSTYTE